MAIVAGMIVKVRGIITSVDNPAGTANVRLVDNNNQPITPNITMQQSLIQVVELPVAVGDVLEEISSGITAVVRWVDPGNPLRWSPASSGSPDRPTSGWIKVGTFQAS